MKTLVTSILATILFTAPTLAADESAPHFLQEGHSYSFVYAVDQETVTKEHLPRIVTVKSHAGGSWYVVTDRGNAAGTEYWINLANVAGITEDFVAKK